MGAPRVVFDCVIFAQAMISDRGPAGACLELARSGQIELVWSDYVLAEIRELPGKVRARLQITDAKVEAFIQHVGTFAELISAVPETYAHPIDSDDSHYINLAIAASASLITSRDRHLLGLMDRATIEGRDFGNRFPHLEILRPEVLLARIRGTEA